MREMIWMSLLTLVMSALTACAGTESVRLEPLRESDKRLACKDIELEMNEAKFYRSQAEDNRGFSFSNVFMPHTYPSTFMSAQKSISASDTRTKYLENVYAIKKCGTPQAEYAPQQLSALRPMPPAMPMQPIHPLWQAQAGMPAPGYIVPQSYRFTTIMPKRKVETF